MFIICVVEKHCSLFSRLVLKETINLLSLFLFDSKKSEWVIRYQRDNKDNESKIILRCFILKYLISFILYSISFDGKVWFLCIYHNVCFYHLFMEYFELYWHWCREEEKSRNSKKYCLWFLWFIFDCSKFFFFVSTKYNDFFEIL